MVIAGLACLLRTPVRALACSIDARTLRHNTVVKGSGGVSAVCLPTTTLLVFVIIAQREKKTDS